MKWSTQIILHKIFEWKWIRVGSNDGWTHRYWVWYTWYEIYVALQYHVIVMQSLGMWKKNSQLFQNCSKSNRSKFWTQNNFCTNRLWAFMRRKKKHLKSFFLRAQNHRKKHKAQKCFINSTQLNEIKQ